MVSSGLAARIDETGAAVRHRIARWRSAYRDGNKQVAVAALILTVAAAIHRTWPGLLGKAVLQHAGRRRRAEATRGTAPPDNRGASSAWRNLRWCTPWPAGWASCVPLAVATALSDRIVNGTTRDIRVGARLDGDGVVQLHAWVHQHEDGDGWTDLETGERQEET